MDYKRLKYTSNLYLEQFVTLLLCQFLICFLLTCIISVYCVIKVGVNMNINANLNVANPNFGAKIKQNEAYNKFIDNMCVNQKKDFDKLMGKLNEVSKGDVLEIYEKKEPKKNPKDNDYSTFFIRNPKKDGSDIKLDAGYRYGNNVIADRLVKVVKNVLTPNTKETKALLTEPVTKDTRNIFQKIGDFFSAGDSDDDPTAYRWA